MAAQVKGIVQGVGFRPFVYRLAKDCELNGWVANAGSGVTIEVEGKEENLRRFFQDLTQKAPSLSHIEEVNIEEMAPAGFTDFIIKESTEAVSREVYVSQDICVCGDCLTEMNDPRNRRYRYPFINCTNCGPRFTITNDIPYDRKHTTMGDFEMCEDCAREYHDPADRRFHAQPIACPVCGPSLSVFDGDGNPVECGDPVAFITEQLAKGVICGIKGLGGYHLACDAARRDAVRELRLRKKRDGKPFAIMAKNVEVVLSICKVSEKEKELLESPERPIVLLSVKDDTRLPLDLLAPDNRTLGVMLPYTPLHSLMFQDGLELLVMTSGNRSGEPIFYKDEEALEGLKGIADYILTGSRPIYIRTDDSVARVFRGKETLIRRSRGYVPFPVDLSAVLQLKNEDCCSLNDFNILACGGELKNTFCLVKGHKAFLSHHIGDLENMETLQSFEEGIQHFQRMFSVRPTVAAYDMHAGYLSTQYASALQDVMKVPVQHHHAHIASCMAGNGVSGPVIGVAFDGTGLGEDGHIWGGEFFVGDYSSFERAAHFEYVPMPGGEAAIKEPWRMAFAYFTKGLREHAADLPAHWAAQIEPYKRNIVQTQIAQKINTPFTSSAGRLFDAVSSMLGLCHAIEYEGQAAIRLEQAADLGSESAGYAYELRERQGMIEIGTVSLFNEMVKDLAAGTGVPAIAGAFHRTLSIMIADVCRRIQTRHHLNEVALSGGVFQNQLLLELTVAELENSGFQVHTHSKVPANDGGLSLGQAAIAMKKYMKWKGCGEHVSGSTR